MTDDSDAAGESGDASDANDSGDEEAAGRPTDAAANHGGSDTVPAVELDLYQLSVSVSGRADDELSDVEETARRLMEYLVAQTTKLEERPDNRGLG